MIIAWVLHNSETLLPIWFVNLLLNKGKHPVWTIKFTGFRIMIKYGEMCNELNPIQK